MSFRFRTAAAALAVSAALFAAPASAITMHLGELDAQGSPISNSFWRAFNYGSTPGAFSDNFTFSLSGAADALGGATVFEFGWIDLVLSSASLSGGSLALTLVDYTPDSFSFAGLGKGDYTLTIDGYLSGLLGTAGYKGNIRTSTSRISEPGTLALLVACLGVLGFWQRARWDRRRERAAPGCADS
ncbi:MAG: FxDxF family PEP-CTERM protein [Burkholderiales bacterium]